MTEKHGTAIEWTHAPGRRGETWNPVTGCTRVSPGCARCYIERTTAFRIAGRRFERVGNEETTGVVLHPERLDQPLRWQRPRLVFVNSLSDLFHEEVPDSFVWRVFETMRVARQHTFQVLTKRPERAKIFISNYVTVGSRVSLDEFPLPNVWLGVSIENSRYTWRADVLRETPAAVRFISAEPLLGSLFESDDRSTCPECDELLYMGHDPECSGPVVRFAEPLDLTGIDWLIAGGESGPGYRRVDVEWVRELRDACVAAGVPLFFKQWGGRAAKAGGRELDGRTWDEFPASAEAA